MSGPIAVPSKRERLGFLTESCYKATMKNKMQHYYSSLYYQHQTQMICYTFAEFEKYPSGCMGPFGVTTLEISHKTINPYYARLIGDALANPACQLQEIYLSYVKFSSDGASEFADAVVNSRLQTLRLSRCKITVNAAHALRHMLTHKDCPLKIFKLTDSGYFGVVVVAAIDVICGGLSDSQLTCFDSSSTSLSTTSIDSICRGITQPDSRLTDLNISDCWISDEGVRAIAAALKNSNNKLRHISLGRNQFINSGIGPIIAALSHENCQLTELIQTGYRLSWDDAAALGKALQHPNCKLKKLSFHFLDMFGSNSIAKSLVGPHCKLTDVSFYSQLHFSVIESIARALCTPNMLNRLNLSHCGLANSDVSIIAKSLTDSHCQLIELNLRSNFLTDIGAISSAVSHPNCRLKSLDLGWNKLTDNVTHLANALTSEHCQLARLSLMHNELENSSMSVLAKALQHPNCTLTDMDISDNSFNNGVEVAIAGVLQAPSSQLTKMNLGGNWKLGSNCREYLVMGQYLRSFRGGAPLHIKLPGGRVHHNLVLKLLWFDKIRRETRRKRKYCSLSYDLIFVILSFLPREDKKDTYVNDSFLSLFRLSRRLPEPFPLAHSAGGGGGGGAKFGP